jgi:hypothetical protein
MWLPFTSPSPSVSGTTSSRPRSIGKSDIREFARYATSELKKARAVLSVATDPGDELRAKDMLLVWEAAASGLAAAESEADVRDAISALNAAVTHAGFLDAQAFMTARMLVEELRKLLGDGYNR